MSGKQQLAIRRAGTRRITWKAAWFVLAAWLAGAAGTLYPVAQAQVVTGTIGITFPLSMQVNPVTNRVYVANFTSETSPNNVVVIDGATNSVTTVTAGIGTDAVAVNSTTNKIYAANFFDNSVTVIDGATNSTTTVATGNNPLAIAVNPVTNKIYVGNTTDNSVTVIDGATNTTTTVAAGGPAPDHSIFVVVNPASNKIYVFNDGDSIVTVIDGASNATTTVNVGSVPIGWIAVNPVTNKIYRANGINFITVIDGATNSTSTLPTGNGPSSIAVNPTTNKIYVANFNDNTVTVIDGATSSSTTVVTNAQPIEVAVDPLTNQIFVGHQDTDTVVIDGNTNTVTALPGAPSLQQIVVNPVTNKIYGRQFISVAVIDPMGIATSLVPTGTFPLSAAANTITNKIYVPNRDSNNVTVIDGATNTTATVASGSSPFAVAVNPITNSIYVANNGDNTVTVIDGATNATTTIAGGGGPSAVAVNPITDKAYVANNGDSTVTVIDGATNATTTIAAGGGPSAVAVNPVTNKIYVADLGNSVTVIDGATKATTVIADGDGPSAIAVNPVTNKIYVANSGGNSLTVIDGATNSTTTIPTGIDSPIAVDVNPITNKIYFANSFDTVTVLDGATNAITTIPVGQQPIGVMVNPATNKIYVANSGDVNVTVIDGATNTILATIPSGFAPEAIGLNPATGTVYVSTGSGPDGRVFVIQEKRMQISPVQTAVAPLPGNITGVLTPTFQISAAPLAPPVQAMYMQIDTLQGPWTVATSEGGGQFTAATTTPLQPGVHIAFAWADPQDDTSPSGTQIRGISSTPIITNIAAYAFLVSPPSAELSPTSLNFGPQVVNTISPAQTVTLTNANGPLDIGGISVSGHFQESDNCPAQLAAGASCTISVMFAPGTGDQGNTVTGAVTITDDNNGIAGNTDTIALTGQGSAPLAAPTITKAFGAANIALNGSASLTFSITNPNTNAMLTGVAFTDNLPAGVVVAGTPNLTNSCGGTAVALGGASSVSLSVGILAASGSCTVSVTVQGTTVGVKNNSVQVMSKEGGTGNTSNASITVVGPPVITKAFGAANIPLNGSTSLMFAIQNNNAGTTLTGVGFIDTLPLGLIISTPNRLIGSCGGGTITATQAANVISLTGASIAPGTSCTFSVNVTGSTGGVKNNTTGNVTSKEGGTGGTASASVAVSMPDLTVTKTHAGNFTQGQTVGATYTITVSNIGAAPTLGSVSVTDALPAGLTATAIAGTGWTCPTLTSCNRSDVLANGSSFPAITLTVSVAINAPAGVVNSVTVSGGGETDLTNDTAADTTAITPLSGPPLAIVPLSGSTNVSVSAGKPAAFEFTVTSSSALLGGINFTCSGLPAGAACSFDKQGESQPQTQVTMTITTTARAKTSVPAEINPNGTVPLYAALLLPFLGLVQLRERGRKTFKPWVAMLLGAFVLLLALVGCGGRQGTQGTPGASYPISVTATSSTTPSVQAVTTVNLTVQ